MAHSHKKTGGCSRSLVLRSVIDRTTALIEVVRKSLGDQPKEVWQCFHNNIYVSGRIFIKLANEFNLSIYHLASYLRLLWKKMFFPIEHMKFSYRLIKAFNTQHLVLGNDCCISRNVGRNKINLVKSNFWKRFEISRFNISRVKTCHSSTRIRFGSSHLSLSKNVIHGMKLHKHEDIIWYYYMEFTFLWKIWLKYGIFMNM